MDDKMTDDVDKQLQSEAIKFWLEEYKVLSSDIQSRVTLQHGLLNFQFLFIGAFVALLATMLRDGSFSTYQNHLEFIALITPIIFSMFVWRHSNHDINIIYKANYIYCITRKKISDITGDSELLTFESFIHWCRGFTSRRFGILAVLGNEHFFHLFFSALSVVVAVLIFLKNGQYYFAKVTNESVTNLVKNALVALDVLAFAGAVQLRIKVAKGYRDIIHQNVEPDASVLPPQEVSTRSSNSDES